MENIVAQMLSLELGDLLYRYDLGDNLPDNWSTDYYSPEHITPQYGRKNFPTKIYTNQYFLLFLMQEFQKT